MESGYHSERWFELDRVLAQHERLRPFVSALAQRLALHHLDAVCGPMTGGAELAQRIAAEIGVKACHTERFAPPPSEAAGLFTVRYTLPADQRARIRGHRVAIVDDAISAGSAVRGTFADLQACGAQVVALGALYVFGGNAARFAAEHRLAIEPIAQLSFGMWPSAECPLCSAGLPFETVSDAATAEPPRASRLRPS